MRVDSLVHDSGFPPDRVMGFAAIEVDERGHLTRIVEKPGREYYDAIGSRALISMNVWRFDERIFDACRDVPLSQRGEYELPEAVGLAVARGDDLPHLPRGRRGPRSVAAVGRGAGQRAARRRWRRGHEFDRGAFRIARHDARGRGVARRALSSSSRQRALPILDGAPQWRRFTPGRIEIFGKHTDYAGGHSLLAAVPRGITLAARRRTDGIVRVGDIFDGQVIEVDPSTAGAARTIAACSATCTSSRTGSSSIFPAAGSARTSRSRAICRAPRD